jgi:Lon protease-like protein
VLIQKGEEVFDPPAEPYSVGCTAKIAQIQPLEQGSMNIVIIGQDRIRILSTKRDMPYLVGIVEQFPYTVEDQATLELHERRLRPWMDRYIKMLSQEEDWKIPFKNYPFEPLTLAYLAAMLLQIPAGEKQSMLEMDDSARLMKELVSVYRREVALLNEFLLEKEADEDIPFSRN